MLYTGNGFTYSNHPYCTDSDILFHHLLTNVLIVGHFAQKRLLNALNVNVFLIPPSGEPGDVLEAGDILEADH